MPTFKVPAPGGGFEALALAALTLIYTTVTTTPAALPWVVCALAIVFSRSSKDEGSGAPPPRC